MLCELIVCVQNPDARSGLTQERSQSGVRCAVRELVRTVQGGLMVRPQHGLLNQRTAIGRLVWWDHNRRRNAIAWLEAQ